MARRKGRLNERAARDRSAGDWLKRLQRQHGLEATGKLDRATKQMVQREYPEELKKANRRAKGGKVPSGALSVPCPSCRAKIGVPCHQPGDRTRTTKPHKARRKKYRAKQSKLAVGETPSRSVSAIPTAFETNRRRH